MLERNNQVRNDIEIGSTQSLIVLTGSNMSGKSTFMRALGMNVSLTMAGSVVNADALRTGKVWTLHLYGDERLIARR